MGDFFSSGQAEESLQPGEPGKGAIGFGCASLFGLPSKRHRRAVLEASYELGIRHYDVAPIYGLGIAEAELSEFLRGHSDVVVATKFGINPTRLGRVLGLGQTPIRHVLRKSPTAKRAVKRSGRAQSAGAVGRLIYEPHDYAVDSARRSLKASLRALGVERIDYFLLHEPINSLGSDHHELVEFLEGARTQGLIRYWGPAGDLSKMDQSLSSLSDNAPAMQMPYDLFAGHGGPPPTSGRRTITFGVLSSSLRDVLDVLGRDPQLSHRCGDLIDLDLADQRNVVRLLVHDAVAKNRRGTVLLSSTRPQNLAVAYDGSLMTLPNGAEAASLIRHHYPDQRNVHD